MLAVAQAAGVQGAVLCGHSIAGAAALIVAAAQPELARPMMDLR
jgi:pimeloyl-ACP methyl ester carboxylesterase